MLPLASTPAVIEFAFDPVLRLGDLAVRWETVAIAAAVLVGLLLAASIARTTPVDPRLPASWRDPETGEPNRLRPDDLLYLVVAAVPGAVVAGRLGYVLLHADYYAANPAAVLDPATGGLALSLAIPGGMLTAALVAALLGAPYGRWLHAATLPLLLVLALGKAALILGGTGQGLAVELDWATAYLGPGPWGSLAPEIPAHPAQAYEALVTTGILLVMAALLASDRFRARDGRAFLLGLALWSAGRFAVAFTWRDPEVVGPLRAEQVIALAVAGVSTVLMVALGVRARRRPAAVAPGFAGPVTAESGVDWPDPATRPRF